MALTARQARFVEEYLIDLNGTQAATRAGYSPKTANEQAVRLLANISVAQAIQAAMDKRSKRTEITADYVLNTIQETIERCRQATQVLDRKGMPVMVETPSGEMVPAYVFDSSAVLKGAELLGKHLKLFTDKIDHSGQVDVIVDRTELRERAREEVRGLFGERSAGNGGRADGRGLPH